MAHPFSLGLNLPWLSCGHDFGEKPPTWGTAEPSRFASLLPMLSDAADAGVQVIRMWVLAGGVNYPVGKSADTAFAMREKRDGRFFTPDGEAPRLSERFLEDFGRLCDVCVSAGVSLVPSLVSFEFFSPAQQQGHRIWSGGRGAIALGEGDGSEQAVASFLNATLEPLLEISPKQAIAYWEVANEPDWVTSGGPLHLRWIPTAAKQVHHIQKTASAPAMNRFLLAAINRIDAAGFRSTIGFKEGRSTWLDAPMLERLKELASQERYVHQLHYYPSLYEPRLLAEASHALIQPCVVGEFPSAFANRFDPQFMRWLDGDRARRKQEDDPSEYLFGRLQTIQERGYAGAWLWSAFSSDSASVWGDTQRDQVKRFARSL